MKNTLKFQGSGTHAFWQITAELKNRLFQNTFENVAEKKLPKYSVTSWFFFQ